MNYLLNKKGERCYGTIYIRPRCKIMYSPYGWKQTWIERYGEQFWVVGK